MEHASPAELEAGLERIRAAPADGGRVELIVRRPAADEREVLEEGTLDPEAGLVGDDWRARGSRHTADGTAHPDTQLTLMNARVIALLARDRERWPLAGDQLYVDLDLSRGNLPAGTRLSLGSAVLEITAQPHNGCKKFRARFGLEALKFLNTPEVEELRLRGIYARVVTPGTVRQGDAIRKI